VTMILMKMASKMLWECEKTEKMKEVTLNPSVVFRDDLDDIAILYNPDNGKAFSLNQTGAIVWKLLSNKNSTYDIAANIKENHNDTQNKIEIETGEFIDSLIENGLAGYVV